MMASIDSNETIYIAKKLTSYGSISNKPYPKERYIKHFVEPEDTLQGIALKYGVTMERVKRANKMWTSDSLFLRPYLLIPVLHSPRTSPVSEGSLSTQSSQENTNNGTCRSDESAIDFLSRIDTSIAKSRDKAKCFNSSSHSEDERPKSRRHSRGLGGSSSLGDIAMLPQSVVVNCGHKVKTSLKKLQLEQDEIFEL